MRSPLRSACDRAAGELNVIQSIGREYQSFRRERHHAYLLPTIAKLMRGVPAGSRVLDAGCGTGYVSAWLHQQGHCVTGIDVSETGIGLARSAVPDATF